MNWIYSFVHDTRCNFSKSESPIFIKFGLDVYLLLTFQLKVKIAAVKIFHLLLSLFEISLPNLAIRHADVILAWNMISNKAAWRRFAFSECFSSTNWAIDVTLLTDWLTWNCILRRWSYNTLVMCDVEMLGNLHWFYWNGFCTINGIKGILKDNGRITPNSGRVKLTRLREIAEGRNLWRRCMHTFIHK